MRIAVDSRRRPSCATFGKLSPRGDVKSESDTKPGKMKLRLGVVPNLSSLSMQSLRCRLMEESVKWHLAARAVAAQPAAVVPPAAGGEEAYHSKPVPG